MRPVRTGLTAACALVLLLPVTSANASTTPTVAPAARVQAAPAPARYAVRPGDTLTGIAARLCGHAASWAGIYHANRAIIGGNPNRISPGQRLVIACPGPPALLRHAANQAGRDRDGDYDHDTRDTAAPPPPARTGTYSFTALENLWTAAGGPSWAAATAARIAMCESGGRVNARNPSSGAAGLFQILGQVVPGNIYDPLVNARNAVAKFKASGNTFAQWVCR